MKRYFDDLDTLHQFTLSLDSQPEPIQCHHCSKQDQFVAHGFVYKKQHQGEKRAVGKRIFCSNRYGHTGCGQTLQLYLTTELALLQYTTLHLSAFVLALLGGSTVQRAYQAATQTDEPRNAYRWLNKLQRKLTEYRALISRQHAQSGGLFKTRNRQRGILLATLQTLFSTLGKSACAQVQRLTQKAFV